jgi:hypothetical protein
MLESTNLFAVPVLFATLCLIIGFEVRRGIRLDFVSAFSASYALMYTFIPMVILLRPSYIVEDFKHSQQFLDAQDHIPEAVVWISLFYLVFVVVYTSVNRWNFISDQRVRWIESVDRDRIMLVAILFLTFGVASFFIYSMGLGGPIQAIISAQLKRSGLVRGEGPFLFFKHFIRIAFVGAYIVFAVRPYARGLRWSRPLLLLISVLIVVLAGVVYASRALFVVALAPFLLYRLFEGKGGVQTKDLIRVLIVGFIALLSISILRPVLLYIADFQGFGGGVEVSVDIFIRDIVRGFGIPFLSLLVALQEATIEDAMAGGGALKTIPSLLPGRLLGGFGSDLITVNNFNTLTFGYEYSTSSYTYQVTAGMLAYYHYEFARMGLLVGGGIAALVTSFMNGVLDRVRHIRPYLITMLYFVIKVPAYMMNGDPATLIRNDILIIGAAFFLMVILPRIPRHRKSHPLVPPPDATK